MTVIGEKDSQTFAMLFSEQLEKQFLETTLFGGRKKKSNFVLSNLKDLHKEITVSY